MLNGHGWRYILTDDGSATILMLPGSNPTVESNWFGIGRFLPDYRVLSLRYPPAESSDALFEGIIAILGTGRIGRMHILGESMESTIIYRFNRKHPERVYTLILLSLGMPDDATAKELGKVAFTLSFFPWSMLRRIFMKEAAKLASVFPEEEAAFMATFFMDQYDNDKRKIIGNLRLVAGIAEKVSALGLDRPFTGPNPVLIINSADDQSIDAEARDALVATYPNVGTHLCPDDRHAMFRLRE